MRWGWRAAPGSNRLLPLCIGCAATAPAAHVCRPGFGRLVSFSRSCYNYFEVMKNETKKEASSGLY